MRRLQRLLHVNRPLWLVAAVAAAALVVGLIAGRFFAPPSEDSAAPTAGPITVPVESRQLTNVVTLRGDVGYADAVDLRVETADLGGPAIVTGRVPVVGATLEALSIAIEVVGRPVIVLPGDLPVYRTLRAGVSGPDVLQLKQALGALGIDAGDGASAVYDAATAAGVEALYDRLGYAPPDSGDEAERGILVATDGVRSAEQRLAAAQRALARAQLGPSEAQRLEADAMVASAERSLASARAGGDPDEIAAAEEGLAIATARRAEALAPRNTDSEVAEVQAASEALESARAVLAEAREDSLTALPASEVAFLSSLPRRVDEVLVERGAVAQGVLMRVSGAALLVTGQLPTADAELVEEGGAAELELPDGTVVDATVSTLAPRDDGAVDITLTPRDVDERQREMIAGRNVRVTIPVGATEGKVLVVPLAALTAGPGGESRVEVSEDGGDRTRLIEVRTGLAAAGFVEVEAVEGSLREGDLVVVGR